MSTEQFNAQLFLRLAQFVVWAERHPEVAADDPEFQDLHERCKTALATRIACETRRIAA